MILISKEQFLEEHNKLSPANLCSTITILNRFREEKMPLLKDDNWCLDKHRIPFISWLSNHSAVDKNETQSRSRKQIYKNYPETH